MSAIAQTPSETHDDPSQLTFRYFENPDGWFTVQIDEYPAAISEGPSRHEAYLSVLDALHDLTHEPTAFERVMFTAEAAITRGAEALGDILGELVGSAFDALERATERQSIR